MNDQIFNVMLPFAGNSFWLCIGLVLGIVIGWALHGWFRKNVSKNHPLSQRSILAFVVIGIWSLASIASIVKGYDIPLAFHIFAGVVLAPIFDPDGKILDKVLEAIPIFHKK